MNRGGVRYLVSINKGDTQMNTLVNDGKFLTVAAQNGGTTASRAAETD